MIWHTIKSHKTSIEFNMNLQENIQRIRKMMGLIVENEEKYTIFNKDTYKISFPKITSEEGALFIFGGLGMGGKSYVYDKVPEDIKENRVVISANYNQTLESIIQEIKKDFENTNETPTDFEIKSVCGFSGGGPSTLKQLGKGYFIGLMDPHIDAQGIFLLEKNVPSSQPLKDIRLLFSFNFWKGFQSNSEEVRVYKDTGKHHPENPYFNLIKAKEILGDSAVEIQASHPSFVNKFFDLFHDLV